MRHIEALNAIKKLGLNESNIVFLGYPDAGLKELFINNWDYNNLFRMSRGSNQFDHSPYSFSYEKNAPYCGANVVKNLNQIMDDFKPNMILIPDDGDDHHDHWATSAFVRYIAVEKGYNGRIYNYLVHKGQKWPIPLDYSPNDELLPPQEILELDAKWMKLKMNKSDEELKKEAVNSHKSQLFAMKGLLESFIRVNEVFSDYPMIHLKKESKEYSLNQGMPSSSFKDLSSDSETQDLQQADDLTAAGLSYDNQNLYMILKSTQFDVDNYYIFHLFLYDGKQFKRMDIQVNNGTAKYLSEASNSISSPQNPEVQSGNNMLLVKVPASVVNGTRYILMTADVQNSPDGKIMDNIALRVFKVVT
jgi:LmbE family N-acetylglucosaminyl deacetylase